MGCGGLLDRLLVRERRERRLGEVPNVGANDEWRGEDAPDRELRALLEVASLRCSFAMNQHNPIHTCLVIQTIYLFLLLSLLFQTIFSSFFSSISPFSFLSFFFLFQTICIRYHYENERFGM